MQVKWNIWGLTLKNKRMAYFIFKLEKWLISGAFQWLCISFYWKIHILVDRLFRCKSNVTSDINAKVQLGGGTDWLIHDGKHSEMDFSLRRVFCNLHKIFATSAFWRRFLKYTKIVFKQGPFANSSNKENLHLLWKFPPTPDLSLFEFFIGECQFYLDC